MAKLTVQQRIINFLRGKSKGYTSKEIANYLKLNWNTVRKHLGNYHLFGVIIKDDDPTEIFKYRLARGVK